MSRPIMGGNANPIGISAVEGGVTLPVSLSTANAPDSIRYATLDAFGRNRVSSPQTLFDNQFHYDAQPLLWETVTVTGGSAAHVPARAAVDMTVDTTSGASVVRQSHRYFRYQPGKSQLIYMTGVLGAAKANVRKRIGYFDAENGVFFESTADGFYVVIRSSTTGSPIDTPVLQSSWNIDPMDGTGPSGITLDISKTQIFLIDLEWLGVGAVRFGFVIGDIIWYVHKQNNANTLTSAYMTTANLPLRYEITNTAESASSTTMSQICSTVIRENGYENERGLVFSANVGITPISVTSRQPVLTIRPKTTLNSIAVRGLISPVEYDLLAGTNGALIELVYNGTLSGGAGTYTSANTSSMIEYNFDHTGITGGYVIDSFYIPAGVGTIKVSDSSEIETKLGLSLDAAGSVQDRLSIVATALTGTSTINAAISWKEIY